MSSRAVERYRSDPELRERKRAEARAHYLANREKKKAQVAEWARAHPEARRAIEKRKQARVSERLRSDPAFAGHVHARKQRAYRDAYAADPLGHRAAMLLKWARDRARSLGRDFAITAADILPLPESCPVLSVRLDYSLKGAGCMKPNSPSIDRKDNSKGYVPGNVWVISYRANTLKKGRTVNELLALVAKEESHAY